MYMYTEWPDKQPLCSLLTCSHTFNLSGCRIRRPEGEGVYELQMTLLMNMCITGEDLMLLHSKWQWDLTI